MSRYLLFGFWIVCGLMLTVLAFNSENSAAILAEVESKRYAVSYSKPVKVKRFFVGPGQTVNVGDPLLEVERPDLLLEKDNKIQRLEYFTSQLEKEKIQRNNRLYLASIQFDLDKSRQMAKIEDLRYERKAQEQALMRMTELRFQGNEVVDSITLVRMELLEEELKMIEQQHQVKVEEIKSFYELETNIIIGEIAQLNKEIELLEMEEQDQIRYSLVDGAIGYIYVQVEELVPSFTNLISVYENNPTIIRAFTDEHGQKDLNLGAKVIVESTNRQYKIEGEVIEIGSRIIEYPARLKTFDKLPVWGREIFIEIPSESNFLNGEKVLVIVE